MSHYIYKREEELKLLKNIIENNPKELWEDNLNDLRSYFLVYHLSSYRKNLVKVFDIKENDSVLEVGSSSGILTEELIKKSKNVFCVENDNDLKQISMERIKALKQDNFVNIKEFLFSNKKYDVITYVGSLRPYMILSGFSKAIPEFLKENLKHLNENGKIYIADDNRLGFKYISGFKDKVSKKFFRSLEENNMILSPKKMLSKMEWEEALNKLDDVKYEIYYPYPSFEFPKYIYSDLYQPNAGELNINGMNYNDFRLHFLNDDKVIENFNQEGIFKTISNAFLIEIIKEN